MPLPTMSTPTYELTVPSTKQKIKYRPFLVKEEKALMLAQQSENQLTMIDTLKSIIKECTFGKLDVDKLAIFDIEYIFVQLRAKSVGEISELIYSCMQCGDPKAKMHINVDLTKLEVVFNPEHTKDILLFDDVGIKMKYPGMSALSRNVGVTEGSIEFLDNMIIDSIDCIYDDNSVYVAAEQTREELEEFINNLTQEQFSKIENFFDTMPKLEKKLEFDCPVCKYHHLKTIQGIDDFF